MSLEAIALCTVATDWQAIRNSYLPPNADNPTTSVTITDYQDPLLAAAGGNVELALVELAIAEKKVIEMTGDKLLAVVMNCNEEFGFLAN